MRLFNLLIPALALLTACSSNKNETQNATSIDSAKILNSKYAIAYQIDDKIVATNIDTTKQVSFGGASDAAISPDGNKLAYTVTDSLGHNSIWYADMENKSQNQIKVNNNNYGQAIWAKNNNKLAFVLVNKKGAKKIGVTNLDNTEQIIFDEHSKTEYYGASWKNANQIIAQDLVNLYTFDLNSKAITSTNIADLLGNAFKINTKTRFFYTEDNKSLIFNAVQNNQNLAQVYSLDLENKKITELSAKGIDVKFLFVTYNNEIVYSGNEGSAHSKIYSTNLQNQTHKVLVDKGSNPSAN